MAEEQPSDPPGPAAAEAQGGPFDIVIEFAGAWSEPLRSAFLGAAERLEAVIVGDLPDAAIPADGGYRVVDDVVIRAELSEIDGAGGLLGKAVPVLVRSGTLLPALADMHFDAADAALLEAHGEWDDAVLHEMLHCLGFGTLWAAKGLVEGGGYVGVAGMAAYAAMGRSGPVPVEAGGGLGRAGTHWSEAVFGPELMTGWTDGGADLLSPLTLASLQDLGYALAPRADWAVDAAYA
jgi:hypothetical protein